MLVDSATSTTVSAREGVAGYLDSYIRRRFARIAVVLPICHQGKSTDNLVPLGRTAPVPFDLPPYILSVRVMLVADILGWMFLLQDDKVSFPFCCHITDPKLGDLPLAQEILLAPPHGNFFGSVGRVDSAPTNLGSVVVEQPPLDTVVPAGKFETFFDVLGRRHDTVWAVLHLLVEDRRQMVYTLQVEKVGESDEEAVAVGARGVVGRRHVRGWTCRRCCRGAGLLRA